jgi:hypothetical protein
MRRTIHESDGKLTFCIREPGLILVFLRVGSILSRSVFNDFLSARAFSLELGFCSLVAGG